MQSPLLKGGQCLGDIEPACADAAGVRSLLCSKFTPSNPNFSPYSP